MKICLITNLFPPYVVGGAERVAEALAISLAELGHEISIITLCPDASDKNGSLLPEWPHGRLYRVPLKSRYWPFPRDDRSTLAKLRWHLIDLCDRSTLQAVDRLLAQIEPEVVSIHNYAGFSSGLWKLLERRGIPACQTLHDYSSVCPKTTMAQGLQRCERTCLSCRPTHMVRRTQSRSIPAVVGVSRFVLDAHQRYGMFPDANMTVIPNERHALPTPAAPRKHRLPLRIGFIGRVEPIKGIELLLDELAMLPASARAHWTLDIAGGSALPTYSASLQNRYVGRTEIRFLGRVDSDAFYREVDIVVVPSLWNEPLPGVAYEPFEYGVPVIGSRVGGIPEIISDGINGLVFDPLSPGQLSAAVARCIGDAELYESLSRGAAATLSFRDPNRQVLAYLGVFNELITRSRAFQG